MTNANQKIVSSDDELLILVDQDDNHTGNLSKADCHDGDGVLHRAFSVFLFNQRGELLLQQRSESKRLWPKYWSNSCCSHPRRGESLVTATARRLEDELDVHATLEFAYKFSYQAKYADVGSENELCSVYLGRMAGDATANVTEIEALRFVTAESLDQEFDEEADLFTPWFRMEWSKLNDEFTALLAGYTSQL